MTVDPFAENEIQENGFIVLLKILHTNIFYSLLFLSNKINHSGKRLQPNLTHNLRPSLLKVYNSLLSQEHF